MDLLFFQAKLEQDNKFLEVNISKISWLIDQNLYLKIVALNELSFSGPGEAEGGPKQGGQSSSQSGLGDHRLRLPLAVEP